ncbi:MAG: protein-disulfide reductase DsbD domain-containing protein [Terracidiphilus sp.]|jgi:hypothetical protein
MIARKTKIILATSLAFVSVLAFGQKPLFDEAPRSAAKPVVVFLYPEQVTIPAGKPATINLHFRVASGLHINSHTPNEPELIPAVFSIPAGSGVRLDGVIYPPGADFTLPLDPTTRLSVYSGEFTIQARIVAAPGNHLIEAALRYQACDNNACMPPKSITAAFDVIGK